MTLEGEGERVVGLTSFTIPHKTILTKKDLDGFLCSEAKSQMLNFLKDLATSVRGKTLRASLEPLSQVSSPVWNKLMSLTLSRMLVDTDTFKCAVG